MSRLPIGLGGTWDCIKGKDYGDSSMACGRRQDYRAAVALDLNGLRSTRIFGTVTINKFAHRPPATPRSSPHRDWATGAAQLSVDQAFHSKPSWKSNCAAARRSDAQHVDRKSLICCSLGAACEGADEIPADSQAVEDAFSVFISPAFERKIPLPMGLMVWGVRRQCPKGQLTGRA